jgi:crotonobetainyl-CoA:carnitine CoA-transferase CaiB-like acyl-CoA transferase
VGFTALGGFRVVDFSSEIAGPYATKLFADAGADVIKVETSVGDSLRTWSATGGNPEKKTGAFFRFLNASKRSVVAERDSAEAARLISGADLVVEDFGREASFDRGAVLAANPGLVLLSISPFGLEGPLAGRPSTEFTIQAEAGSIAIRGLPGQDPYQAGARTTEWIGGTFASVAALAALQHARRSGSGEHIDFSLQEVMALAATTYMDLMWGLFDRPPLSGSMQNVETPSIHRTRDGFVGFNTNTQQQMSDFLLVIERPDLMESGEFNQVPDRMARLEEWESIVNAWTAKHTTAEIVEKAALFRVPVAPVVNGRSVLEHEHLIAREIYSEDPSGGFQRPRPPYRVDDESPPAPRAAPELGADTGKVEARERPRPGADAADALPLQGLRILDVSNWWAGPSASHFLACLGAEVIHIESTRRPDGARMIGGMFAGQHAEWWECSTFFLSANTNKSDLAVNLNEQEGREILWKLLDTADVLLENYSPRVMDGFGFTREAVAARKPDCLYARMPAFGLDGPWRDYVGFAQTMEQMSGLAWLTGHVDDQPRIQRGPCDPLAGVHAAFAMLAALERRKQTGAGAFLECTMVEGALNAAAEQVVEYTAYGNLMERQGNRCSEAAPQGLYETADHAAVENPRWLALSIRTDEQWHALLGWLGSPPWVSGMEALDLPGRRKVQDRIDAELAPVFRARDRDELVGELLEAGVPAAALADQRELSSHPQFVYRGTYEELEHPIVGRQAFIGMPFRFASVGRWLRTPAPLLGQDNARILAGLGYSEARISELKEAGVIGNKPEGL